MSNDFTKIIGVDYGSKLAGTTAICYFQNEGVQVCQSAKKQDADKFILQEVEKLNPEMIFLDAPLSLPGVYLYPNRYSDYFYREADRNLKAMSPMFLGGLTARAICLKRQLELRRIQVKEIYPAQLAKLLDLTQLGYKKEKTHITSVLNQFRQVLPFKLEQTPENWHQIDAILAFYSGYRYLVDDYQSYGIQEEGIIIV